MRWLKLVLFAVVMAYTLGGCGGAGDPAGPSDLAQGPDLGSLCGHPGDVGNSLGVGKYCTKLSDCSSNTKATLCSTLGSDNEFFCTMPCMNGGPADQCGDNATCQCQGGRCGCYPNACP